MKVIKIEYHQLDHNTFELFDSIEKAFSFIKLKGIIIKKVSLVEVNDKNIYYEDNGELNYNDNSELFI